MMPRGWLHKLWAEIEFLIGEFDSLLPLRFFAAWVRSRNYVELLLGLPAVVAGLLLAAAVWIASMPEEPLTVDGAMRAAIAARGAGDDELAELYLRKADVAVGGTAEARFQQALLLWEAGDEPDAMGIMQQLAPIEEPGYLPAQEWLIRGLSATLTENLARKQPTAQELEQRRKLTASVERRYELIVQANPDHVAGNQKLAALRVGQNRIADAVQHLGNVVDANEELRLLYAQLLLRNGDHATAQQQATLAAEYYQRAIAAADGDDATIREAKLKLATALTLLEQYEQAAKTLVAADNKYPEDPPSRDLLGDVLLRWSDSIEVDDGASLVRKFQMLDNALNLKPRDERILARIAAIAGGKGEAGRQARLALKEVLASGMAPGVVHVILGMHAFAEGDVETATRHYELANRANPNTPLTLNNLAMLTLHQTSPDLDQALGLMQRAIELKSDNPEFYDSRGQVYLQMKRYTDAIADFELAIRELPLRADIHERMAEAYRAIGDEEQAEIHQRRAK